MRTSLTDFSRLLAARWPSFAPTPLVDLPATAERCRVAGVLLKDESRRPLGNFKFLGGMYAGLQALAAAAGTKDIGAFIEKRNRPSALPRLLCASDGNHGLAVAAAAELAGTSAKVYLHRHVSAARARRIVARKAEIVWVEGTYDDAVDAARTAAARGEGLLISDTSDDPDDPVTADVMAGYGLMADEIAEQLKARRREPPTHLFVQAGVGGLAAALARGLCETHSLGCRIVVVEPDCAACVGPALRTGRIARIAGDLQTAAEMLSCGEASAPAVETLRRVRADAISVDEADLKRAVDALAADGGPKTTASGATGYAGLSSALPGSARARALGLDAHSRVLLIVTEGAAD